MKNIKREIIFFEKNEPQIDYKARTPTKGAELDMVHNFIVSYTEKHQNSNLAFFIEPHLATGYPDIVIVHYENFDVDADNDIRLSLKEIDLKVLFEISRKTNCSMRYLCKSMGYGEAVIRKSINKLADSNMIFFLDNSNIRVCDINTFFSIKKIVSVEAKIDKINEVICQSFINQWFSGESYIFINHNLGDYWKERCVEKGMGVFVESDNDFRKILKSEKRKLPVSYASLLFNEWIYRKKIMELKNAF